MIKGIRWRIKGGQCFRCNGQGRPGHSACGRGPPGLALRGAGDSNKRSPVRPGGQGRDNTGSQIGRRAELTSAERKDSARL